MLTLSCEAAFGAWLGNPLPYSGVVSDTFCRLPLGQRDEAGSGAFSKLQISFMGAFKKFA